VVHDHLMWAIVDVLGDAVTPEVAAAWDEVYSLMANALINQERGLYSARGVRPETVWRPWRVEKKIRETAEAHEAGVRTMGTSSPTAVRGGAGLMLAMATIGFALTFWAWALLSPLGSTLREQLGLSAFQQALLVAVPVLIGSLVASPSARSPTGSGHGRCSRPWRY